MGVQDFLIKEAYVAFISMLPIVELRGAIPIGAGLGLPLLPTYIVSVIANCIPVPFILWLAKPVIRFLKQTKLLAPLAERFERKAEQNREKIMKYTSFALFLFVAIPLPGTGAWTGSIIASILEVRPKYAIPAICFGVLGAGIIMSCGTGIVQWIINLF